MSIVRLATFLSLSSMLTIGLSGCGSTPSTKSSSSAEKMATTSSSIVVSSKSTTSSPKQATLPEWKSYRSDKLEIEVSYPTNLKVQKSSATAITAAFDLKGYESTNLRDAQIMGEYSNVSEKTCLKEYTEFKNNKKYADLTKETIGEPLTSTQVRDGVTWYRISRLEPAAGNRYRTVTYLVPHNKGCYKAELTLHSVERMNYDEDKRPSEYDPKPLIDTFEKMIASIRFLK